MRVFLDTNVLASAFATRGLCADLLREVFASEELCTSPLVLSELRRVLRDKFGADQNLITDIAGFLQQEAIIVRPGPIPKVAVSGGNDLLILASALSGKAAVFVTGDKELLDVGRIGDLEILSPRQYWERRIAQPKRETGRGKPGQT